MTEDPRALWLRAKVCQSLGVTTDEFDALGSQDGTDGARPGVEEIVALLDASRPGNIVFYRQLVVEEVEVAGACRRVCQRAGHLAAWLAYLLSGQLADRLAVWLAGRLDGWMVG